jgi:hypothetical protein
MTDITEAEALALIGRLGSDLEAAYIFGHADQRALLSLAREGLHARKLAAALERALRLLTKKEVLHYLFSNTRTRGNGAHKATLHEWLTKTFVAVHLDCDCDLVRRHHEAAYKAVHDATARGLTDRLDEVIGFDLDARHVGDEMCDLFFTKFDSIARAALTAYKERDDEAKQ